MRFPNIRRFLAAIIMLPVFSILFFIHHFFLILDYIIFPSFLKQKIIRPCFIVAAPRSGTTFLFHTMAEEKELFTSTKLWELIFAPAITQKYLILSLMRLDGKLGSPLKVLINKVESLLIGKFKTIHLLGLNFPEEDEVGMIWNLNTLYLSFFYPDSDLFHSYYFFDETMSEPRKKTIMKSYLRMVQRHNYVFNRCNQKRYLSKNPMMMNKVASLKQFFPDANLLTIIRTPANTIPSTIALNSVIYQFFTNVQLNERVEKQLFELIIKWYKMFHINSSKHFPTNQLVLDFSELISQPQRQLNKISAFLKFQREINALPAERKQTNHISKNYYVPLSEKQIEDVFHHLPYLKNHFG